MITAEFEKERKRMKEELKKSLRTYGALLLLGVTGVPLGAAVGLIEALFCRLLLKVTAVRVAHLFWCLPFLAMAGLVIVAVNQKFGGRGKGGMSLIFDVAYEEETELPLRMIPLAMLSTALTHLFGGSAGREGVAVQIGAVFSYFAGKKLPFKNAPGIFLVTGMAAGFAGMFGTPIAAVIFAVEVLAAGEMRYEALLPAFTASFSASAVASLLWNPQRKSGCPHQRKPDTVPAGASDYTWYYFWNHRRPLRLVLKAHEKISRRKNQKSAGACFLHRCYP